MNAPLSGLSRWLSDEEFSCEPEDVGDAAGLIPGSGRSPEGGNGNPLQYSCLERRRSLAGYSPWGHKELDMTEVTYQQQQHSMYAFEDIYIHCYQSKLFMV